MREADADDQVGVLRRVLDLAEPRGLLLLHVVVQDVDLQAAARLGSACRDGSGVCQLHERAVLHDAAQHGRHLVLVRAARARGELHLLDEVLGLGQARAGAARMGDDGAVQVVDPVGLVRSDLAFGGDVGGEGARGHRRIDGLGHRADRRRHHVRRVVRRREAHAVVAAVEAEV
ncbi:MAG: hypothetical protein VX000_03985, partial [Myxococcota bacterium]|nr:hypothetical protein [Myxococcota bacterium]